LCNSRKWGLRRWNDEKGIGEMSDVVRGRLYEMIERSNVSEREV